MTNLQDVLIHAAEVKAQPGDYTGEDGLLYCGKCRTPKQFRMTTPPLDGMLIGRPCQCEEERLRRKDAKRETERHTLAVDDLKRKGFTDPAMRKWHFTNDNGKCPQIKIARTYVEKWDAMRKENIGCLFWGGVGTGKSYAAGCIANALMEQEVSVRMTNFATVINDLTASFEGRNEYITRLCRFALLIIDDFGMERGTEYGLEQVYNVIDSRYRSNKPLIVTTNLPLKELQNPQDIPHARIYDRLLAMCAPIRFDGENLRRQDAQEKRDRLKCLMN